MQDRPMLSKVAHGVQLQIVVKPNSRKQSIKKDEAINSLIISIKSPPEKGKANKELIKLLSKTFGCSSSAVLILTGHTSQDKTVLIQNIPFKEIKEKLERISKKT